jgi:hypothetical protein
MSTTLSVITPIEGVNFNTTYLAYDQTAAVSSTNSPDNPGPPFTVGTVVSGQGGSEFIFVKASAAIAAGDVCQITTLTSLAAGITTANGLLGNRVGVAQVAIASGSYGWLQLGGACQNINVIGATVPNVLLYSTTTAGTIDDASTTGNKTIAGIVITATSPTATGAVAGTLNWPVVGATTT